MTIARGGKDFQVPLADLSEADIAFVREKVAALERKYRQQHNG